MIRSEEHVRQCSEYWALISTIRETDRAKDVEHLNDVFENFASETNTFEGRFGKMTDEDDDSRSEELDARGLADQHSPRHEAITLSVPVFAGQHHR